jgi:hypothetical protein
MQRLMRLWLVITAHTDEKLLLTDKTGIQMYLFRAALKVYGQFKIN